ncbi:MAG: ADP-forming succinate--CoA ligase subunit beta [Candidatus Eisenbacteria bacterium]|uniref:Succinate--CoA ligase [ADP-forming] subunit beta n=1 Tax=Eiseniibacteriota bacterium TaxID=2212470 RepID=A0A538SK92_UNCEI|nr:MAG: ADP-forming succinate--CoA ligase subunit beta [Candidatus Eisenbacteria bacterium]
MNLREYQGRELFARYGLPVLPGQVASTPEEARDIAVQVAGPVVIKAQVMVGGRGKAGGVKLASTPEEAFDRARDILALTIKGLPVRKVLVAQAAEIARELYLAIVLDRSKKLPLVMFSSEGGVDIEEVARSTPEKIVRLHVPLDGLRAYQARALFQPVLREGALVSQAADVLLKLWRVYSDGDCQLAEINPLAITPAGKVIALDAKVILDDNAEYRHREWEGWRDREEETAGERLARDKGLSYVKLEGDIGCVVNGAGLAMATMDLVKHYGGEPANFLDIGGSSSPEKVTAALKIITGDARDRGGASKVRAILFNIFGGITRCDDVANGIVQSLAQSPLGVPLVIRLTGTNEEAARKILADHGLTATTKMDEGVREVIAKAQEVTV